MNCNNETTVTKTNCSCENCTPIYYNNVDKNDYKLTPVFINNLYNCTSKLYYEYNSPSVYLFNVASSNYTYPNNGKVKINKISISYDNIGLPLSTTSSIEVYFDGKLMKFTPEHITTIYFQGVPLYLSNDLTKKIINTPICCCNNEEASGKLVTVSQINQVFITSNFKIKVYGCIDDLPFSAITEFDIASTAQALGFSYFNNNIKLFWPNVVKNGSIFLKYNPAICANSICPITSYSSSENPNSNGYFYAVTNLLFTNTIEIDLLKTEPVALLTNNYNIYSDMNRND